MSALLDVRSLRVGYGGMEVLTGLNLSVEAGERVAMLGRNGIGKSTLMRTLIGVYSETNGDILFDGQVLAGVPSHRRFELGIGYVPQGRRLFSRLSVKENLEVGRVRKGRANRDQLERVLEMFPKLGERYNQLAGTLSGGEQQMVAVGRALIGEPKLLLLDEPSEGLAPVIVESLVSDIARISEELGFALLIVEQNIEAAVKCTDRAVVLDAGSIVLEMPSSEVLGRRDVVEALAF